MNKQFQKIIIIVIALAAMTVTAGEAEWQVHMDAADAAFKKELSSDKNLRDKQIEQKKLEVRSHLKAAIKEAESFAEDDPRLADTLSALGTAFYYTTESALLAGYITKSEDIEETKERIPYLERALSIREKVLGEHIKTAGTLTVLAVFYSKVGRQQDAVPLFKRSIKIRENINDKPENILAQKHDLAEIYYKLGRYQDAEPLYQELLSFKKKENSPYQIAFVTQNLAKNYYGQGKLKEAEELIKQVITIQERMPPNDSHRKAYLPRSFTQIGKIYRSQGRFTEAEEAFKRAINLTSSNKEWGFLTIAKPLRQLLDLYAHQGRKQEGQLFRTNFEKEVGYKIEDSELLIDPKDANKL